jgi:hypothetical protein
MPAPVANFDPTKSYLLSGKTLNEWLRRRTVGDGRTITQRELADGTTVLTAAAGTGSATTTGGAFCRVRTRSTGDPPVVSSYLQSGQVSGGTGNESVEPELAADVTSPPADGTLVWLAITGDGVEEDGLILPGFDVTGVAAGSGSSLPANTLPEAGSSTGRTYHHRLGEWTGGQFVPDGCGNIAVHYCPGSYYVTRG